MNTNTGNDPMLSSFINDDWVKFSGTMTATASPAVALAIQQPSTFLAPVDEVLSPDNFSDLASMWSSERRRVSSVKMEEDSFSSYSVAEEMDEGDTDMGEIDMVGSTAGVNIKREIEDHEYCDAATASTEDIQEFKFEINKSQMTEAEARRFVEAQFAKIAFVPKSNLSQREKIESIVARSDCRDFSVEDILNFDKKCPDSARACAKIVQNIPQRYRWECVLPEDIPCCYTIVADCKKVSSRDKPPRPMNAFMIWAQGARRLINELCPKMQNAIISEALGFYWREKSESFKQRFEQEKMNLRTFHNVEFPEYKYKPKTKVQKAKEKEQRSITKAKLRASVKQEKLRKTEESNIQRKNGGGRPKREKQNLLKKEDNDIALSRFVFPEAATQKSPTKPAIKDMLTMKILNDRKCREAPGMNLGQRDSFLCSFDQMSPLEAADVDVNETTDDVNEKIDSRGILDNAVSQDKDITCNSMPSSVFDTPAHTPPVDHASDDRHPSTPLSQQTSIASPSEQTLHISSNRSSASPTLTSSPNVEILPQKQHHCPPPLDLASTSTALSSLRQRPASTPDLVNVTDWLFNFISQSVSEQSTSSKSFNISSSIIDSNNNSSDFNNNCYSDANNNTDLPVRSVDSRTNTKLSTDSPVDASDLDTLLLDLSAPLFSDDDLRSILTTL